MMAGTEITEGEPLTPCGCGGRAIAWERDIPFTGKSSIEIFCSKHCGICVPPHVVHGPKTYRQVRAIWNRALSTHSGEPTP